MSTVRCSSGNAAINRSRVRCSSRRIEAFSGSGVVAVMAWPSRTSFSSGSGTKARRCCCLSAVEWQFLTIARSHTFTSVPRSVSNARKARRIASCTTSSASPGAYDNHRANLYAASKCGSTSASNRARFSSLNAKTHAGPILFPWGPAHPQKQVISDGYELIGGANQRRGRQLRDAVDLDRHAVLVPDFLHQEIEIAVTRGEHHDVRLRRVLQDIQGDAHVPISFCRSIVPLDERPQFHLESYGAQDVLKLPLLLVSPVDRVRNRGHDLSIAGDFGPKTVVVEMPREVLPRRVIDILHIDEDGHGFHQDSLPTKEVGNGDQYCANTDEQHQVGHEVREHHQCKPTDQRNSHPLLLAVNEIS